MSANESITLRDLLAWRDVVTNAVDVLLRQAERRMNEDSKAVFASRNTGAVLILQAQQERVRELRRSAARRAQVSQRAEVRAQIRDRRRREQPEADYDRVVDHLRALSSEALASLPPRTREVLVLYYGLTDQEPWSQDAIAERLGISRGLLAPDAQQVLVVPAQERAAS